MTPTHSPIVRRRRLAAELGRLRQESGKTLTDVAAALECSPAKISRIETAAVTCRVQDLRDLLDLYAVPDDDRPPLVDLARQSRGRGWWYSFADLIDEPMQTLVGLEDEASRIMLYEPHCVPGLLQTTGYAQAIMALGGDFTADELTQGLDLRIRRQAIFDREPAPELLVVLDEAALRRAPAGADVMAGQYDKLLEIAARPTCTLQVLPLAAGLNLHGSVPFSVLWFAGEAEPQAAYAELPASEHLIDRTAAVGQYAAAYNALAGSALPPAESADLVGEIARAGGGSGRRGGRR
jgi:transcriptional regulator with XRE-family HTH domain